MRKHLFSLLFCQAFKLRPPPTLKKDTVSAMSYLAGTTVSQTKLDASLFLPKTESDLLRIARIFEDFLDVTLKEVRELVIQDSDTGSDMLLLKGLMCLDECDRTMSKHTNRSVKQFCDRYGPEGEVACWVAEYLKCVILQYLNRARVMLQIVLRV